MVETYSLHCHFLLLCCLTRSWQQGSHISLGPCVGSGSWHMAGSVRSPAEGIGTHRAPHPSASLGNWGPWICDGQQCEPTSVQGALYPRRWLFLGDIMYSSTSMAVFRCQVLSWVSVVKDLMLGPCVWDVVTILAGPSVPEGHVPRLRSGWGWGGEGKRVY